MPTLSQRLGWRVDSDPEQAYAQVASAALRTHGVAVAQGVISLTPVAAAASERSPWTAETR